MIEQTDFPNLYTYYVARHASPLEARDHLPSRR